MLDCTERSRDVGLAYEGSKESAMQLAQWLSEQPAVDKV